MSVQPKATAAAGPQRRWRLLCLGLAGAGVVCVLAGAAIYWAATRPTGNGPGRDPLSQLPDVPEGEPWFADMTAASGIDFTYRNGEEADLYTILESVGGGVAMIDFDGDGRLDLFFSGGGFFDAGKVKGHPCKLFKNLGNWKFADVTAEVGLDKIDFYSHGAAVADYNNDGWPDLLVTGFGRVALFRNEAGKRFIDVTAAAKLNTTGWCTGAGFADLTGTGYPDLYICHYLNWSLATDERCDVPAGYRDVCPPQRFIDKKLGRRPPVHVLYRNNGDGTFRDAAKDVNLRDDGCGLGVVLVDLNGDGKPDIYVANDASDNHLYLNRGGGKLEERATQAGVAGDDEGQYNGSMGVDAADYTGQGRPSLFVCNFQNELHGLYQNLGREVFAYQSNVAGMANLSKLSVGFGAGFVDVDGDGWEDLFFVNGHVFRRPYHNALRQKPSVMRNIEWRGRRFFQDYSKRGGAFFQTPAVGRGVAIGDLDNDGWPDAVISHTNSKAVLLKNIAGASSKSRWLGVKLVGKKKRDVVGATLVVETERRSLTRFTKGGGSYLSACDQRVRFGLGEDQFKCLIVKWPNPGKEQRFDAAKIEPGAYWEIHEDDPTPRRMTTAN